jgi:hypothetical protein
LAGDGFVDALGSRLRACLGGVPLTFTVWFNLLVINLLTGPDR